MDKALLLAFESQKQKLARFNYWVKGQESRQRACLELMMIPLDAQITRLVARTAKREERQNA